MMDFDIQAVIPHRPPFLLVDEVLELSETSIRARTTLKPDDELWSRIYSGHYPGNPLTPGVLLCEIIFQASAILVGNMPAESRPAGVPVVTRIQNVKFKNMILPGDTVEITSSLEERMANAFFMKGAVRKDGKLAVQAEFAVALVEQP